MFYSLKKKTKQNKTKQKRWKSATMKKCYGKCILYVSHLYFPYLRPHTQFVFTLFNRFLRLIYKWFSSTGCQLPQLSIQSISGQNAIMQIIGLRMNTCCKVLLSSTTLRVFFFFFSFFFKPEAFPMDWTWEQRLCVEECR